jgi:hypothetical protein
MEQCGCILTLASGHRTRCQQTRATDSLACYHHEKYRLGLSRPMEYEKNSSVAKIEKVVHVIFSNGQSVQYE